MKTSGTVRTLAVIPARGGSQSIPGKNIIDLCGHPLIYYSIREAHRSARVDATIVSTDDEQVARVARELGADVPFLRPPELSGPDARDIGFLKHALDWVRSERNWRPEYVTYLAPTTPSRTAEDIDAALELLMRSGADSVRTMVPSLHFNPYKMWVEGGSEGRVEALFPEGLNGIPRRQLKRSYMPVGAVYAMKASCIDAGVLWGSDVRMAPFPYERYVDIDYPDDLRHAADVLTRFSLV